MVLYDVLLDVELVIKFCFLLCKCEYKILKVSTSWTWRWWYLTTGSRRCVRMSSLHARQSGLTHASSSLALGPSFHEAG